MFRRRTLLAATLAVPTATLLSRTAASADPEAENADSFPTELALPNGFMPEGIAIGRGPFAYFGSRANGRIFRVNLRTGVGADFSPGPGTPSTGLKVDDEKRRLFVSGASGGNGRVVSTRDGTVLASYQFTTNPSFVNDVIVTPDAAYFTDSLAPQLYRLSLRRGLPDTFTTLPLSGDFVQGPGNNSNGIERTPDGRALLVIQSSNGTLHRVDPATGVTKFVDIGGLVLTNGDGLLVQGRILYVVQNRLNQITVLRLNSAGTAGTLVVRLGDSHFDVPTTIAPFGNRLYLPNARFTTPPTPETTYNAVAIPRPRV
jgi:sugar lactone lactonase YvrE